MRTLTRPTLTRRILKCLDESKPYWTSTPDLIALYGTGLTLPRHRVWNSLLRLHKNGLVERENRGTTTYWRAV